MARDDWSVNKEQYIIRWEFLPVVGHTVFPGSDDPCAVSIQLAIISLSLFRLMVQHTILQDL